MHYWSQVSHTFMTIYGTTVFELFQELYARSQGIRRLGAASLDFCYVAMGRFDCFYEFGLKPWDVCAGRFDM